MGKAFSVRIQFFRSVLARVFAAINFCFTKLWDWPVVIFGSPIIYGLGAGALFGDEYILTGSLFFVSLAWLTAKVVSWEEVRSHENRRYISALILLGGAFLFALSLIWIRTRSHSMEQPAAIAKPAAASQAPKSTVQSVPANPAKMQDLYLELRKLDTKRQQLYGGYFLATVQTSIHMNDANNRNMFPQNQWAYLDDQVRKSEQDENDQRDKVFAVERELSDLLAEITVNFPPTLDLQRLIEEAKSRPDYVPDGLTKQELDRSRLHSWLQIQGPMATASVQNKSVYPLGRLEAYLNSQLPQPTQVENEDLKEEHPSSIKFKDRSTAPMLTSFIVDDFDSISGLKLTNPTLKTFHLIDVTAKLETSEGLTIDSKVIPLNVTLEPNRAGIQTFAHGRLDPLDPTQGSFLTQLEAAHKSYGKCVSIAYLTESDTALTEMIRKAKVQKLPLAIGNGVGVIRFVDQKSGKQMVMRFPVKAIIALAKNCAV